MAKKKSKKSRVAKIKKLNETRSELASGVVSATSSPGSEHAYVRGELIRIMGVTAILLMLQLALWGILRESSIDEAIYSWIRL